MDSVDAEGAEAPNGLTAYWARYGAELVRARDVVDLAALTQLSDMLLDVRDRRAQLFILGNGASAASESHRVFDFGKGTNPPGDPRSRVATLMDWMPWHSACANDLAYCDALAEQLRNWLGKHRAVVGDGDRGRPRWRERHTGA